MSSVYVYTADFVDIPPPVGRSASRNWVPVSALVYHRGNQETTWKVVS